MAVFAAGAVQVWQDGHKRSRGDPNYLTLWKPIAPAGYVSMGVLASLGGREPPSYNLVRWYTAKQQLMHALCLTCNVALLVLLWCCQLAGGGTLLLLMHSLCLCCIVHVQSHACGLRCADPCLCFYEYVFVPLLSLSCCAGALCACGHGEPC
jgi:hypothetical protein